MAGDSAMTVNKAVKNSYAILLATTVEANHAASAYLDVSTMDASKVIFLVAAVGGSTGYELVVKDGAQYTGGAVGDLEFASTASGEYVVGPLETARFKDSDGYIQFMSSSADTNTLLVRAILLP